MPMEEKILLQMFLFIVVSLFALPFSHYVQFGLAKPEMIDTRWQDQHALRVHKLLENFNYIREASRPAELPSESYQGYHNELSAQIWTKFQKNQEAEERFRYKMAVWAELVSLVQRYNNSYQLKLFGSTFAGFSSNGSDLDLCLVLPHTNGINPREESVQILQDLSVIFNEAVSELTHTELVIAVVPILIMHINGIEVDINVNHTDGVINSLLLHGYNNCDWRVRPLAFVVKLWANVQGINDAKKNTLSSNSLVLMVVHYLQHIVTPLILPAIATTPDKTFLQQAEWWRSSNPSNNATSLAELLLGFLEYFAVKFDYRNTAISVRTGTTLTKTEYVPKRLSKKGYKWKHICIEDPFDNSNTARAVIHREGFDRIRGVLFLSWQRLGASKGLDTIFEAIPLEEATSIGAYATYCTLPYRKLFGVRCLGL